MRKRQKAIDCSDLIQQFDKKVAEIDNELGLVAYSVITVASNGVADLGDEVSAAAQKTMDTPFMRHRTAEELSKWDAFSRATPMKQVLDQLSPEANLSIANFMSKWVGLPSLLAQATTVRKLMLTSTSLGSAFAAVMSTDFGSQMASACAEITGLSASSAEMVTGVTTIIAGYSVAALLHTAIAQRAHASYDNITAKAQGWNDNLERGWKTWLPKLTWLGLNKLINPHPALSEKTLDALKCMSNRIPTSYDIPKDESLAVAAITDHLARNYGMMSYRAGHVAINLLAHDESNPNRLLSILKTRDLPTEWISHYKFDPRYCVPAETVLESAPAHSPRM